jgi:hypothetical protein
MRIDFHAFWLQKAGYAEDEYEDAFARSEPPESRCREFRCAVADGATETSFSGLWARILVDAYVDQRLHSADSETIRALSDQWRIEIDQRTANKPLPWYAQEKLQQGAFSSLLGLTLRADGGWRALCIGDSCLFHVRPREAIWVLPYHTPEQFNNHPALISTNANVNHSLKAQVARGRWVDGDYFLLMTDALAHFFLSQQQHRARLVAGAFDLASLQALIERARSERICRNDDVTFLKVSPRFGDAQGVLA